MLLQALDWLIDVPHIPELDLTVVPTAGQIVLLVGIEVQVSHQLTVGILNTVDLTVRGKEQREQDRDTSDTQRQKDRDTSDTQRQKDNKKKKAEKRAEGRKEKGGGKKISLQC